MSWGWKSMVEHSVIRENVAAPDQARNFEPAQILIDSYLTYWFVLLKNTQAFYFFNDHFKTTLKPFQPNAHSLSLSLFLNPLFCLSLSCISALFTSPFYRFWFHINTLIIWWEVIIAMNWLNLNGCFIWGLLTIKARHQNNFSVFYWRNKGFMAQDSCHLRKIRGTNLTYHS